ncbi:hypothetical protein V3C99_002281 [Haemonchus contortus]|uniref:Parasitic stage specific protein 2 n=1 Tax=Haemonchus contortus TaxID=6289 RepID=E0YDP1_HAECO|nr:parasitic stage specific protein 2 [Haemonchus contortus]CDJ83255.1 Hypothetical protein CBG13822 [Haemonchus contortus]
MKPDEARAALKPHYEALLKNMNEGKFEENFKHFHPHCAVVHRGKGAYYGKEQIGAMLKKLFEEQHPKNIKRTNEVYCGCECCICVSFDITFDSPKGAKKVSEQHIWKKHENDWKLYHAEYDMN